MKHPNSNSKLEPGTPPADIRSEKTLRKVIELADSGQPDFALATLNRININTDEIRNARGVCLMRLGRIEDALRQFRSLVLASGSTWMKPGLPVVYRTNFCTALLLAGHPAGCLEGLKEIGENTHPSVIRLRQSLDRWQSSLTGWAWLMWKLGAEPNVPVTLDFVPGEFGNSPVAPRNTPPQSHPSPKAA